MGSSVLVSATVVVGVVVVAVAVAVDDSGLVVAGLIVCAAKKIIGTNQSNRERGIHRELGSSFEVGMPMTELRGLQLGEISYTPC